MKIGSLFLISFILLLLTCSESKNPIPLLWNGSSEHKPLRLDYGNGSGSLIGISPEPNVEKRGTQVCWDSRNWELLDYGPRLSICFPEESDYEFSLDWIFHSLDIAKQSLVQSSLVSSYPRFSLQHESGTVHFDFITETALRNLWRQRQPKNYILGDLRIKKFLNQEYSLKIDNDSIQLSLSYGLPYWNYYGGDECFFFFSSWDLDIPANQRRILRIQFDCDYVSPQIRNFYFHVQSVHENAKLDCEKKHPIITEFFSHGSSRHGRYIEIHNAEDSPLCHTEIMHKIRESDDQYQEKGIWIPDWEFIFPQATILLANSDSRLHAYDWVGDFNWSAMANSHETLIDIEFNMNQSMSGFRFEEDFIAQRKIPYPCSMEKSHYHTNEKFCGSPGFHFSSPIDWGVFCSPEDIRFTELNFWGIQDSSGFLDSRDRFLEFIVQPKGDKNICDISSLYLDIENQIFPLFTGNSLKQNPNSHLSLVKNGDIILISLSNKFPRGIRRIPRNLFQLNPARSISVHAYGQPNRSQIVWNPGERFQNSQFRTLFRDSRSSLYSLVPVGDIASLDSNSESQVPNYIHHPPNSYDGWSSSASLNYMSPGDVSSTPPSNLGGLTISEVLWSGSYRNGSSILNDRFIEWKTDHDALGSFYLSITYPNSPNRNQTYLIPLEKDRFTFLSRGNLECFPWIRGLQHNQFSLFNDPVYLKIQDEAGRVHQEIFLDTKLFGLNQTSQRFRASAIYFPGDTIGQQGWNTSQETESSCPGEVAASPGSANSNDVSKEFVDSEN
ncbi:MAG: hypothetical protein JJT78_00290 [Leptospira sp.]|nr:hypothetical protein [Leptospira sp.]